VIERLAAGTIEGMNTLYVGALCLCLVAVPLTACDDSMTCTLAGCGATLDVFIEVEGGGPLPDSTYEIVLELDGAPYVTACGQPEPGMFLCEPVEGPDRFEVDASPFTDGTKIWLSVWADGGEGDGPESVHLTVIAGDAPLVDTTAEPTYAPTFPNGEECGPRCLQAELITATFPRP
jgi:hypothetical protein